MTGAGWFEALTPEIWARANRELLAKIITELSFEEVLSPEAVGPTELRLPVGEAGVLTFTARPRHLGHWRVDPTTLRWHPTQSGPEPKGGARLPEVTELVAMMAEALRLDPSTAAGAIQELSNSLLSDTWQLTTGMPSERLVDAEPHVVESQMRGHPWIVANKGRLGFGADDLSAYAPEAQGPVRLHWLAAAPGRADTRSVAGLDHPTVMREQLGADAWGELQARTEAAGLDPDTVTYVPVHPWQWHNRVVQLHAADLAHRRLVPLGEMPGRYWPQQSIRTLVDADHPERRYLKLPLSILNTSVYRGLPRQRTLAAPALTDWFTRTCGNDPFLKEAGLVLLGEVASVSVAHPVFEALPDVPYQHTEMLGAIWRESVEGHLTPGERAVTLAVLLHRDPRGVPYLGPLIERSGLAVGDWIDRLHEAVLPPLVHVLYRFGATFSPHAQNCLLVLADDAPTRLVVKDFVDDAMIAAEPLPELADLPAEVRRCLGEGLEAPLLVQWIQGGLLMCVYRYVSEIVEDHFGYPEAEFWASARRALWAYQDRFDDELAGRYALFDLDAPAFVKLCLNRVRLFERGYADDPERPVAAAAGWVDNPLAAP